MFVEQLVMGLSTAPSQQVCCENGSVMLVRALGMISCVTNVRGR